VKKNKTQKEVASARYESIAKTIGTKAGKEPSQLTDPDMVYFGFVAGLLLKKREISPESYEILNNIAQAVASWLNYSLTGVEVSISLGKKATDCLRSLYFTSTLEGNKDIFHLEDILNFEVWGNAYPEMVESPYQDQPSHEMVISLEDYV